jgi:hypothetical protein
LASDNTTIKLKLVKADSVQILTEFVVGRCETETADPFYQWLHDNQAVRIDWSTFGIKKLQSELRPRD